MSAAPAKPATRTARPERPPAPALPQFDRLDRAHREVLEVLHDFERLLEHVGDNGPDEQARASARHIQHFFNGPARQHHSDEERTVFPGLLAAGDPAVVQHVRRLQQDHGWLEEDWIELSTQIEAIANGYNWYDLGTLRQALPVFVQLYREHIALEESMIYPLARRQAGAG
ncbi:MAG: hemerythrin domain-containing protein [Rubrivivax sp.]|nr:hemerythrin domain-containing protein [Rubrivivax sp.]